MQLISIDDRPVRLPQYRKIGTVFLQWVDEPFKVQTAEGLLVIDQNTEGWDDGFWVSWPDDGTAPYPMAPPFERKNYALINELAKLSPPELPGDES